MTNVSLIKELTTELESRWKQLWDASSSAHPFNSPQWFKACVQAFDIRDFNLFVCIGEREELHGVLPLVRMKKFGVNVLGSPGKKYLDKSTILARDKATTKSIMTETLQRDNLYLSELDNGSLDTVSELHALYEVASMNPFIALDGDPLRNLANRQRNYLQNMICRHEEKLEFQFNRRPDHNQLKTMFEMEVMSHKKKLGRDIFSNQEARNLFQSISALAPEHCSVSFLYFDGEPVAHIFGLIYKKTFLAYHMAYLEKFRKMIPGKILLYYLLNALKEAHFETFDFSRGSSILKNQFTKTSLLQYNVFISASASIRWYWRIILLFNKLEVKFKRLIKSVFFTK